MAFLVNLFRRVSSRIVNVGFHKLISCQVWLEHRRQYFCGWKILLKLRYRIYYVVPKKHWRFRYITIGFLDLISKSIFIDILAKPIIRCLMYLEAKFGFKGSHIVGSRAHLFLPINYVLFGWVKDLSDYFEFLLITDFVYLRAWFLVLDFGWLRNLLFLQAWCVVMVMPHSWSLLVWILDLKSGDIIAKWMSLRYWFLHS